MKGFTLVEMLVALFVFGLLAAAGVGVMSFAVDNQAAVKEHMARLGDFQRARQLVKSDLEQAAVRRTRDEAGAAPRAAFGGGEGERLLFLVRRGWDNPDEEPRASLQYVEYRLVGGRLERRARSALDGAPLGDPQVVLEGVEAARVAFLSQGEWRAAWVPSTLAPLPQAVRLDLDLEGVGETSQLFLMLEAA